MVVELHKINMWEIVACGVGRSWRRRSLDTATSMVKNLAGTRNARVDLDA